MTLTIEEIAKIDQKLKDDDWRAWQQITTLAEDEPEGVLASTLWQAQREDKVDLGRFEYSWQLLKESTDFDAADFAKLITSIAVHMADKGRTPWSDGELPGWSHDFTGLFDSKRDDDEFFQTLAQKWSQLPTPYSHGVATRLAQRGKLPPQELPKDLIEEHAKVHLNNPWSFSCYGEAKDIWPSDQWHDALIRVGTSDSFEGTISNFDAIKDLVDVATPEQFVTLLARIGQTAHSDYCPTSHLTPWAERLNDALLDAVSKTDFDQPDSRDTDEPNSRRTLVACYLSTCLDLSIEPAGDIDENIQKFIRHYATNYENDDNLVNALAVIPRDRLEPIFVADPEFLLVGACPTDAVSRAVVARIQNQNKDDQPYGYEAHASLALNALGEAAVSAIADTLDTSGDRRQFFVEHLSHLPQNPQAIESLAECLTDKSKAIRDLAIKTLPDGDANTVLALIEPSLAGKAKPERIASATVLLALPPTAKRFELAQERLKKEKTKEVKALLEQIQPAAEGSSIASDEDAIDVIKNEPARWIEFKDLGSELLNVFRKVFGDAGDSAMNFFYGGDHGKAWKETLKFLGEDAIDTALEFGPAISDGWLDSYLDMLDDVFGKDVVGEHFAQRLTGNLWVLPTGFEKPKYGQAARSATSELFDRYEAQAEGAALLLLEHKNKTVRDLARYEVSQRKLATDVEPLIALLDSRRKDVRAIAAELLPKYTDASVLPALEARLAKEKADEVKKQLSESIITLSLDLFDVDSFDDDTALDEALRELPEALPSDLKKLTKLKAPTWKKSEKPMSKKAFTWFLSELTRETYFRHGEKLVAVCDRLVEDDLFALCESIIKKVGYDDRDWVLFMQGSIAGPERIKETGRKFDTFARSEDWNWGGHGVEVMVRRNTLQTVQILEDWHHKTRLDGFRKRTMNGLNEVAEKRDVPVDDVLDHATLDLGFDDTRQQTFDFGSRIITVRLNSADQLSFHDVDADKTYKSMPKANKSDDTDKVDVAREEVSRIKKELTRLRRNVSKRLQAAMNSERRWTPSGWTTSYVSHPVLSSLSRGLVWAIFDTETDEFFAAFHVDHGGECVDLEENVHILDEKKHRVGVVHPALLSAEERDAWTARFLDFEILKTFDQMERDVYLRADWPGEPKKLATKLDGVPQPTFYHRLKNLGWELGMREDAGLINYSYKSFGPYSVEIRHDGFSPDFLEDDALSYITSFEIEDRTLDDVSPLTFSEIVRDLVLLTKT